MREFIQHRDDMLRYLSSFCRQTPGMAEDMFQEAALLALANPRPLSVTVLHKLANEAAVGVLRQEKRHHPR